MARLDHPEAVERVHRRDRIVLSIFFFCLIGSGWAVGPPATAATVDSLPQLVKAKVQALGLGAKVKIATVFRREEYRGYITRIDDDSFEVTDVKNLTPNVFQYLAVDHVRGRQFPKPANHAGRRGVISLLSMVSRVGFGP